jgi:hypothetical protein
MLILDLGVGAIFFAVGLILSWSKSAKGSAVVTFLLGLVGGGSGGAMLGKGHFGPSGVPVQLDASSLGGLLLAIGVGTTAGLALGTLWKLKAQKNKQTIDIGMAQPKIDPKKKID